MIEIDLHGVIHEEALTRVEDFVLRESQKGITFQCRIITGNSKILQDKIINQILLKHKFKFYIPSWNNGEIIVS